jgi:flagellar hook-associated protein 3 FlgL
MRISTTTIYETGLANLQQQTARLMQIQQQIGASRRILTPSDDPSGSARVLEISQSQGISQQYDANLGAAGDSLSLEESVLGGITELLQSARDTTNTAGNGGFTQSDRLTLANQLRSQYQELLGLANSTDSSGQFLFAGYRSATSAFSQTAPGVVSYNGDQGQRLMQVGPTRQIAVSDSGEDLFRSIPAGNGYFVAEDAKDATTGKPTNTGTALIDNGTTLDAVKWNNVVNGKDYAIKFSVSSSGAISYDIIDNSTAGAGKSWITGGTPGTARPYTSGSAIDFSRPALQAFDLGANLTTTGIPKSGDSFIITNPDGAGGDFAVTPAAGNTGTATIAPGTIASAANWTGQNITIKFDVSTSVPPVTTYDIIDNSAGPPVISLLTGAAPAATGPYPRYYASGSQLDLSQAAVTALDLGAQVTVSGTPKNSDSFDVTASANQDVFKTMNELADLLETSTNNTALTNGLGRLQLDLDNALNNVISVRSSVGSRMKEIDNLKNGNDSLALQYSQSLSQLQDLDYAKAASDFAQQQVTLQAAQQTFVKVSALSLFNYL